MPQTLATPGEGGKEEMGKPSTPLPEGILGHGKPMRVTCRQISNWGPIVNNTGTRPCLVVCCAGLEDGRVGRGPFVAVHQDLPVQELLGGGPWHDAGALEEDLGPCLQLVGAH